MELKIKEYQIPEKLEFNYSELKTEIENKLDYYNNLVYSDSEIKDAKADKAKLNKLKKALNDERIRQEKKYLKPFNEFKNNINEIINILDKPIKQIDTQIKEYDSKQKSEKRNKLKEIFENNNSIDWLVFEKIFNPKWLNASVSLKKAENEIINYISTIKYDLEVINEFQNAAEILVFYKKNMNLNEAIQEGSQLIKEKQKNEKISNPNLIKNDEEIREPVQKSITKDTNDNKAWIGFKAYLSVKSALELKAFFNSKNIEFQPIEIKED